MTTEPPAVSRAACNRAHARRRAAERYGLDWAPGRIAAIEAAIRAGSPEAFPLRPDDRKRNRQHYAVREGDAWVPVVYDAATASLVSVLPPHALDRYRAAIEAATRPAPPPPPPPPPPWSGPRVLTSLPAVPAVAGDAPDAAIVAAIAACARRLDAIPRVLGTLPKKSPYRRLLADELERTAWRRREMKKRLRRRGHEAYTQQTLDAAGVEGPPTPRGLLAAALAALSTMAFRLGYDLTPQEQAAKHAVQNYLSENPAEDRP